MSGLPPVDHEGQRAALLEFASQATQLNAPELAGLDPVDIALAMGIVVADKELSLGSINPGARARAEFLRLTLPSSDPRTLVHPDAFVTEYLDTLGEVRDRFDEKIESLPPEGQQEAAMAVAGFLAQALRMGEVDFGSSAGVTVRAWGKHTVMATTRLGEEVLVPRVTGTVVELGSGIYGGTRRVEEGLAGIWPGDMYLLDRSTPGTPSVNFAGTLAQTLAKLGRLDPNKLHVYGKGMRRDSAALFERGARADLVIASEIGNSDRAEVRAAVANAAHLLRPDGGVLLVNDYSDAQHEFDMVSIAQYALGYPTEARAGVAPNGRSMRTTVFRRPIAVKSILHL